MSCQQDGAAVNTRGPSAVIYTASSGTDSLPSRVESSSLRWQITNPSVNMGSDGKLRALTSA